MELLFCNLEPQLKIGGEKRIYVKSFDSSINKFYHFIVRALITQEESILLISLSPSLSGPETQAWPVLMEFGSSLNLILRLAGVRAIGW